MRASEDLARARRLLCATVSAVEVDGPTQALVLNDADGADLVAFSSERRIVPLLKRAVQSGTIRVSASLSAEIDSEMTSTVVQRLRCESALLGLVEIFDREGVDSRVLKGLATGSLDYERPVDRQVGDVDVLVPAARIREVLAMLDALPGWEPAFVTRRWASELEHAFTFSVGGVEVDVHHRLLRRAPGFMLCDVDLFEDPATFEMHGHRLRGLSNHHRLLHAAGHLVTSPGLTRRWSSHADVLRLCGDGVGVGVFRGHAQNLVALGVEAAHSAAGIATPREYHRETEDRYGIGWAYGRDRRLPLREHLLEIAHAPPSFSAKNQISWVFSSSASPARRLAKLRSERFSSATAEAGQSSAP